MKSHSPDLNKLLKAVEKKQKKLKQTKDMIADGEKVYHDWLKTQVEPTTHRGRFGHQSL